MQYVRTVVLAFHYVIVLRLYCSTTIDASLQEVLYGVSLRRYPWYRGTMLALWCYVACNMSTAVCLLCQRSRTKCPRVEIWIKAMMSQHVLQRFPLPYNLHFLPSDYPIGREPCRAKLSNRHSTCLHHLSRRSVSNSRKHTHTHTHKQTQVPA